VEKRRISKKKRFFLEKKRPIDEKKRLFHEKRRPIEEKKRRLVRKRRFFPQEKRSDLTPTPLPHGRGASDGLPSPFRERGRG
jgi:hypothetical protein